MKAVGIDIGGTKSKFAVLEDETVVLTREIPTRSEDGPEAFLGRVANFVRETGRPDAIGVALPALIDEERRIVLAPNLDRTWAGYPVGEHLDDALRTRAAVLNDGHAFTLAESVLGAGRDAGSVIGIVCGTGIGGGLVLGSRLQLGVKNRAGEVGHHTVVDDGPVCACGNRGCLELYAGARAIARNGSQPTFEDALAAAQAGDAQAQRAFEKAGTLIGRAVANLLIFVCPERVVIGGGVASAGDLLFAPLLAEVEKRARVAPLDSIAIVSAELGPIAGAAGAAVFARS